MSNSPARLLVATLAVMLLLAACGGNGGADADAPGEDAARTEAPDGSAPGTQDGASTPDHDGDEDDGAPGVDDTDDGAPGDLGADDGQPLAPDPARPPSDPGTRADAAGDRSQAPLRTPVRAVWVHLFDDTLKSPAGIDHLVEELRAADATAVIAQVARRHDAYYASDVLPPTSDPTLAPGHDVIRALTERAQAAGIEVHAWISIAPTTHPAYDGLPAPDGWLTTDHGREAPVDQRWVSRTATGAWTDYLDPALPEVRDHVAAIVEELARETEVDGIHLDYARYEHERAGYHPRALARFAAETGGATAGGRPTDPAPDDPAWVAWRQRQSRGLVEAAREALDRVDRPVALTAATIVWGEPPVGEDGFATTRAATEALQDWPDWVRTGLVDAALPMTYLRDHEPQQAAWWDGWLAFHEQLASGTSTLVVPGIGGWLNRDEATLAQLGQAVTRLDGAALYSYQQPTSESLVADGGTQRPIWQQLADRNWGDGP